MVGRVLTGTALVALGTIFAGFTATDPGWAAVGIELGKGLTGLAAGVLATDIHAKLAGRLGNPGQLLQNHDLTLAVGNALSVSLHKVADQLNNPADAGQLRALAKLAAQRWRDVLEEDRPELAGLQENNLPDLFARSPEKYAQLTVLTRAEWRLLLERLARATKDTTVRDVWLSKETWEQASAALPGLFPQALREVLKYDLESGGRAYAGLTLLLMGEILAVVRDLREAQAAVSASSAAALEAAEAATRKGCESLYQRLDKEQRERHQEILKRFDWIVGDLKAHVTAESGRVIETLTRQRATREPIPETTEPVDWDVPYQPTLYFTGREGLLREMEEAFKTQRRVALTGISGVGKTELAVACAGSQPEPRPPTYFLVADSPENLTSGLLRIAQLRGLVGPRAEAEIALNAVQHWLTTAPDYLLILDNANHLDEILPRLPTGGRGRILLTTQDTRAEDALFEIPVAVLSREDGATLLLRRAGRLAAGQTLAEATPEDREGALALNAPEYLDGLALALEHAGAYMNQTGRTPQEYRTLYDSDGPRLRQQAFGGQMRQGSSKTIATTFLLALNKLQETRETDNEITLAARAAAIDLLTFCAFLAPDAIPEELMREGAPHLGEYLAPLAADALLYDRTLAEACHFSLLQRNRDRSLRLHRQVQFVLRDHLALEACRVWEARALEAVNAAFPRVEFTNWPLCRRLLPHALAVLEAVETVEPPGESQARLLNEVAYFLKELARYSEAEPLYLRALGIYERVLGGEHPSTATTLNNLALLYEAQGKLAEAEPLYVRSLGIMDRALPFHPNTATIHENYAVVLQLLGRDEEALTEVRKAQEIQAEFERRKQAAEEGEGTEADGK